MDLSRATKIAMDANVEGSILAADLSRWSAPPECYSKAFVDFSRRREAALRECGFKDFDEFFVELAHVTSLEWAYRNVGF